MRISRTALPHLLHARAYGTYPAGATFGAVPPHSIAVEQLEECRTATAYSTASSRRPVVSGQSPETPGRFSLRLDVYPPPQVLQIDGRLYHLVLAFPYVGVGANGRAPSLRGRCSASPLLRTHPPPSRLRPTSRVRRLYGLPCSGDFAPGRGGLLQLLGMSLSPCCRFHPAKVSSRVGQISAVHVGLRPSVAGSALGDTHFRGHNAFTFVTAR